MGTKAYEDAKIELVSKLNTMAVYEKSMLDN
jgi:hypothetical protein